jgi:riboflavin synthase
MSCYGRFEVERKHMFTGIVEGKARLIRVESRGQGKRWTLELPRDLTEVQLGDSISLNGVCLTVSEKKGQVTEFDISPETLQKSVMSEVREGEQINVERALRLSDRLGGHIVTGHIDGVGIIIEKKEEKEFHRVRIRVPRSVSKYIVQKGSIAVDGISLTVNEVADADVELMIIPFTLEKTTLPQKKVGDRVNVETDILGKYIEKLMDPRSVRTAGVDLSLLAEHGFIKPE